MTWVVHALQSHPELSLFLTDMQLEKFKSGHLKSDPSLVYLLQVLLLDN